MWNQNTLDAVSFNAALHYLEDTQCEPTNAEGEKCLSDQIKLKLLKKLKNCKV